MDDSFALIRLFRALAICLLVSGFTACQSPAPSPTPERAIAAALDIGDAITLRYEGDAIDAAPNEATTLTRADALSRALHRSPELQASLAHVRVALAEAEQARLLANPILNFILRFPEGGGTANLEAGVSADLLSVLQRPRRRDAADNRLRSAVADSVSTSLAVAAAVQERYADVHALDELRRLLRERRAVLGRLVDLARSRLDFGEASKLDVTTLQAQAVELDLEIAEREAERREVRLELARLIGEPTGDGAWTLESTPPMPELAGAESTWLAVALEERPEVRAGKWELAALGDEAAIAGLSVWQGTELGINAQRDPDWSLGPTASVPLPLFDQGEARRDRAQAAIIEARHKLVATQRTVVEEVRRAYASYSAARANLERVRNELIPLQRQRREQVEGIYLAGQADVTAVLLAEQDLQASQAKEVELERKATVSLVRLERAVGGSGTAKRVGQAPAEAHRDETYLKEQGK